MSIILDSQVETKLSEHKPTVTVFVSASPDAQLDSLKNATQALLGYLEAPFSQTIAEAATSQGHPIDPQSVDLQVKISLERGDNRSGGSTLTFEFDIPDCTVDEALLQTIAKHTHHYVEERCAGLNAA